MDKKKRKKSFWSKIRHRYQFNVMSKENYEVKSVLTLSILNITIWILIASMLVGFLVFITIAFTPLKQYIPGYGKTDGRQVVLKHKMLVDSLLVKFEQNNAKLEILEKVLKGDFDSIINPANIFTHKYDSLLLFSESIEDSILRAEVELREQFTIFNEDRIIENSINEIVLYPPIKGVLSDSFQFNKGHFGIDIIADKNKEVKCVLDGTVIFSEFTIESGYVIGVYHQGDLISIYKHNSKLNKKVGDIVLGGDVISMVGNTGELSSGPHLHFELWYQGVPINPLKYISFE